MADKPKPRPTVPLPLNPAPYTGPRAASYFYMHDMRNHVIRAYGDVEYGDVHDINVPHDALVGMFRDVCVVTDRTGTWIVRHRENGSLYLEDARGTDDPNATLASTIITDTRQ